MKKKDARALSKEALDGLRQRAVHAVRGGMSQTEAARVFGVSRVAVAKWMRLWREGGEAALKSGRKGRPRRIALEPWQAAQTVRLIKGNGPDQLKLPFALWTREAATRLIEERFGVSLSVWTIGRYLKRWGFTPQKPTRRAFERDEKAVRRWLDETYPQICRRARAENAEIHWGDEMGLRSDCQTGRSYSPRGKTPAIEGTGRRFGCNMISSITNRGVLRFMVYEEMFSARVFLDFLDRLVRGAKRTIFLIVDGHPAHRSKEVKNWLAARAEKIRLFFLPPYSPDLNPDEFLNNDVKANSLGRRRAANKSELIANVRAYLRSTQKRPDIVENYFRAESVRYAAA